MTLADAADQLVDRVTATVPSPLLNLTSVRSTVVHANRGGGIVYCGLRLATWRMTPAEVSCQRCLYLARTGR